MSEPLVPVYRMHQPTLSSPCIMGAPCPTCAIHAKCQSGYPCRNCRRGIAFECERAYPTPPAFVVRIAAAVQLVRDGAAVFIHKNNALQLTFARLTYLRDTSSKINGTAIWEYAAGSRRVRIAVDLGWRTPIAAVTYLEGESEADVDSANATESETEAVETQRIYAAPLEA